MDPLLAKVSSRVGFDSDPAGRRPRRRCVATSNWRGCFAVATAGNLADTELDLAGMSVLDMGDMTLRALLTSFAVWLML